jgi:hypothetical protein
MKVMKSGLCPLMKKNLDELFYGGPYHPISLLEKDRYESI